MDKIRQKKTLFSTPPVALSHLKPQCSMDKSMAHGVEDGSCFENEHFPATQATELVWEKPTDQLTTTCADPCDGLVEVMAMSQNPGSLPSGKLTFCYGKSQFFMGKSTINDHFQ